MKNASLFVFFVLVPIIIQAQFKPAFGKKILLNQNTWLKLPAGQTGRQIPMNEINRYSDLVPDSNRTSFPDTINTSLTDTLKYNMYGDLLNDNPLYYKKSSLWMFAFRVTLANVTTFLIDRYIFNYNFSRVGFNSWKHNIKTGWE